MAAASEKAVWKPNSFTSSASSSRRPTTAPAQGRTQKKETLNGGRTFDAWCHRKDVFDKGLELLNQLDSYRWERDTEYEQLTAALVAIDESLEVDADAEVRKVGGGGGAAKTMFDVWKRRTMEKHALTEVPLSKRNEADISETVKQYASKVEVVVDGRTEQRLVVPQMKYMFPAVPKKKGDQVKGLTKDQKVQNAIFLTQLRRRWLLKRDEVVAKAGKLSIAFLDNFLNKEQAVGATSQQQQQQRPTAGDLKRRALQSLGVAKLHKWVEEDHETAEDKVKEDGESKRHEASHAHDAFVRSKKALELWLPLKDGNSKLPDPPRPPPFVFATGGRGKGSSSAVPLRSKQNTSIASSTVDMMRSSGLRVVHALSAGRQGRDADLEKSRGQLEREGYVSKRNYAEEVEYNAALTKVTSGSTLEPGERVRVQLAVRQQKKPSSKGGSSSSSGGGGMEKSWVTATVERRTATWFQVSSVEDPEEGDRKVAGKEIRKLGGGACLGSTARVEGGEEVRVEGADGKWSVKRDLSSYEVTYEASPEPASGNHHHHHRQHQQPKRETRVFERDDLKKLSEKQQRQAEADESYKEWVEQKRSREQAWECLKHTESPDELVDPSTGLLADEPTALAHWKAVGKNLKVVDRGLLDEWFEWSKGFQVTYYVCQVLWDSFEPIGDDVHSQAYSLARSTLAHVLRPGLGYQAAADKTVQRKWRAAATAAGGDDIGELEDASPEELAAIKMFDRKDLRALLRELGIELRADQLRLVVDCFDDEGDRGKMDVDRFLEFTGPQGPRDKVDARQRLKKRTPPVWESTCPKTGLSNAFRVTTAPESAKDTPGDARVKILSKKNGEKRQQVELKERQRRIAILRHFDEINDDDDEYIDNEGDEYDRDESDGGYDDDEFDTGAADKPSRSAKVGKKSTMAQWLENNGAKLKEMRKEALKELKYLSRMRRDEAELQTLLETGQPPGAPVFYAAGPTDEEVMRVGETLEESLLLCWEAAPSSLVAFFSIEMSGPRGSREQRENIYHEIFRDPDSAKSKFRYMTWIRDLEPGTSYAFRIRAFNGFGPGPYNWEIFTTRPRRPNKPSVLSRSPTSITLRWVSQAANADVEAEGLVRQVGDMLDVDFPHFVHGDKGVLVPAEKISTALRSRVRQPAMLEFLASNRSKLSTAAVTQQTAGPSSSGGGEPLSGDLAERGVPILDALDGSAGCLLTWDNLRLLLLQAAQNGSGSSSSRKQVAPSPSTSQVRYNIEQCQSVTMGQWRKVLTTKFDHATITALESGRPYRFRVIALNANGLESKKSLSVVTTTLLETPPPPRVVPSRPRLDTRGACVKLAWDPAAVFGMGLCQREQRKQNIDKILNSWTQEGADDEGAVSVAATFRRQQTYHLDRGGDDDDYGDNDDNDGRGVETVSEADALNLLRDLGLGQGGKVVEMDATAVIDAKLSEVKDLCEESRGDGGMRLSLFRFKQWWTSDAMTYEMRRDGGSSIEFLPQGKAYSQSTGGRTGGGGDMARRKAVGSPGACSILCYRGTSQDGRSCLVAGLEPNFTYRFNLRLVTSQSVSAPSRTLEAHTPPASMERPVVISDDVHSDPKCVALKWYPGRNGAHKYLVECKLVEALDWEHDRAIEVAQHKLRSQGWRKCFEGRDNTARLLVAGGAAATSGEGLLPNSVYHFRVTALNAHDVSGPPSDHTLCRTANIAHRHSQSVSSSNPLVGTSRRSGTVLKPSNAHEHFTVECRGNIVVGDTVICTEQLFVGLDGNLLKGSATQRSIRFGGNNTSNFSGHRASTEVRSRVLIGERTIAAHVVKDSYRTLAKTREMGGGSGGMSGQPSRMLRLEVIWSTCSSEDAAGYLLAKDDIIERDESALSEYEVFRAEWKEEKRRLSEAKERKICRKLLISGSS